MFGRKRRGGAAGVGDRFFATDDRGVAAVEFAFLLPVMLLIYLGLVELARGMRASQKVDLVAHVVADLAGQQLPPNSPPPFTTCSATSLPAGVQSGQAFLQDCDFANFFAAAAVLLAPLPTNSLKITISEVNIWQPTASTYQANVNWTHTYQGGAPRNSLGCGPSQQPLLAQNVSPISSTSMPTAYTDPTQTPAVGPVIVVDVSYGYALTVNAIPGPWSSTGTLTMLRTSYAPVRNTFASTVSSPPYPLYNHIADVTTSATAGTNCLYTGWGVR